MQGDSEVVINATAKVTDVHLTGEGFCSVGVEFKPKERAILSLPASLAVAFATLVQQSVTITVARSDAEGGASAQQP